MYGKFEKSLDYFIKKQQRGNVVLFVFGVTKTHALFKCDFEPQLCSGQKADLPEKCVGRLCQLEIELFLALVALVLLERHHAGLAVFARLELDLLLQR
jgi:hypothetical protein